MSPAEIREGSPPTPRELAALRAYLDADSYKGAAKTLGVTEATVRGHLYRLRIRSGASHNPALVWKLRDLLAA